MTDSTPSIVDPSLASEGLGRISWAADFMPALAAAKRDSASTVLAGRKSGVVLTLEPKTANLALALAELGAEVSVYSSGSHTSDSVAAGLVASGVNVYARSDADARLDALLLHRFVDDAIELLVDDGAGVTRFLHTERRDGLDHLVAVAEETTSGVRPLRNMAKEGVLAVPCMAVNDARTKQLFDNVYGTGQSVVMTLLDVTNIQLQGKVVVVVGYGFVGRGIAAASHALGAKVVVTEIDPVRALQAIHEGHRVSRLATVCPEGDVFFTASGIGYSLTGDHMRLMKDGAIVSVGGAGPPEVTTTGETALEPAGLARPYLRTVPTDTDRAIFLVADGECSNVTAAEGNPIEIMDLSLAVQLRTLAYLAENATGMEPGVYAVPDEVDSAVARSVLRSLGAEVDEPSRMQIRHTESWNRQDD